MTDIEPRALARSIQWSAIGAVAVRIVGGGRSLVLARFAGPENLGILAAVVAFSGAAALISDSGLRSYLIHLGPEAHRERSATFRVALATGVVAAVALALSAPALSRLYHDERVIPVAFAMAFTVIAPALVAVPSAMMRLDFRFRDLGLAQLGGEIVATGVGISVALSGHGLAALVAASISAQVVGAGLLLLFYQRGRSSRDEAAISEGPSRGWRQAATYGATVSAGGLLWVLALQGDNVAIGHLLGPRALGLYAFAFSYGTMPGALVAAVVGDVAAPAMALAAKHRLTLYRDLAAVSAILLAPITATAFVFAAPAVRVVLGEEWIRAIRPLQVMLLLGFVRAVFPTSSLLRALGRVRVEPAIGLVGGPLTVAAAVLLARHGLAAVAIGVTVVAVAGELAAAFIVSDAEPASRRRVLLAPVFPALVSAGIAAVIFVTVRHFHIADAAQLVVAAPLALGLSLGAVLTPERNRALARTHIVGSQRG
ncbi:MAG: oligosaccharide flippase family protein [Actinobacteria bacterium]|nr:oligosaccharide flippase family protein [Actinomycetota bacterium]